MLFLLPLYATSSTFYTVNLAVSQNKKALNKKLSQFPIALRNTIAIKKIQKKYRVQTLLTKNKTLLTTLLPAYKKVFPDAVIEIEKRIEKKTTKESNTSQEQVLPSTPFHMALHNKKFYLCPVFGKTKSKKFLIEVSFKNTTVSYNPIIGNIPPMEALYKIEDNKLFLYQKGLFNKKVFSLFERTYFKYHLISSWVKEKRVKKLRYYFNLHDAKAYLNLH
jgi:hypothetical protein